MEAPEVPLEAVHEHLEHHAHHSEEKWISWVALSTAILAAFAAVASLLAGDHVNEAMISQIRSSDQWNYYQAKSIKAGVLGAKIDLMKAASQPISEKDSEKIAEYAKDQPEIQEKADELEKESEAHLQTHVQLARSVTMFQIAIAVSAISALTKRRAFWIFGLVFGVIGIALLTCALLGITPHFPAAPHA
jgi:hypothetical protein